MGAAPSAVLEQWVAAGRPVSKYAIELIEGVERILPEIDRIVGSHAEGWAVHRMAVVDRTILRVACYELGSGLPAPVAISEAVEAAKELSTGDSGRFINGILGRVVKEMDSRSGEAREEEGNSLNLRTSARRNAPPPSRPPSGPS
jgi:transcription antitermination protein NusB